MRGMFDTSKPLCSDTAGRVVDLSFLVLYHLALFAFLGGMASLFSKNKAFVSLYSRIIKGGLASCTVAVP